MSTKWHAASNQEVTQTKEGEYDIFPDRAGLIVQELIKTARMLRCRGYGTANLIFSDLSFVSLTDSGVISEVAALLRAGVQPLGYIAPHRKLRHAPFAESWKAGDETVLAELRRLAESSYGHRTNARETQQ
jgi:hypothetical protein